MNEKDDALNKSLAAEIGYAFQDLTGFAARIDLENRIVAALTTARKEAREAAVKDLKRLYDAIFAIRSTGDREHPVQGYIDYGAKEAFDKAIEAAANVEEGGGDGR